MRGAPGRFLCTGETDRHLIHQSLRIAAIRPAVIRVKTLSGYPCLRVINHHQHLLLLLGGIAVQFFRIGNGQADAAARCA